MPVYEYQCPSCGKRFSKLSRRVAGENDPLPACPACGVESARALSPFAYHRSLKMQIEQIDPRIERELDAADSLKGEGPLDRLSRLGGES